MAHHSKMWYVDDKYDITRSKGQLLVIGCTAQRLSLLSELKGQVLISYIMEDFTGTLGWLLYTMNFKI